MDKKEILKEISKCPAHRLKETFLSQYDELYKEYILFKNRSEFETLEFKEIFYHFVHDINELTRCKRDGCEKKPNMLKFTTGYSQYCSTKCRGEDPNWFKKVKTTVKERYGIDNVFQLEDTKIKSKKTIREKYGVDFISQNKDIIEKTNKSKNNIFIEKYKDYNIIEHDEINVKVYCNTCKNETLIYKKTFFSRRNLSYNICTTCNPINSISSNKQIKLFEFIKNNYNGTIISSDSDVLNGRELDIYLPELKLAFEFNGLYWHSEFKVDKKYHIKKTEDCLRKNIQLIHIWEDDWDLKQSIVKSRILNLLGKSEKIYARNCVIKEISYKDSSLFLNENHIQGKVVSKVNLALFYNNELVSLMTFGGLRKNLNGKSEDGTFELLRFCNKLNFTVVGGSSKLFNYFIKNYNPKTIISFADRCWSKGNLYYKLGFTFVHNTDPNYSYLIGKQRENRFKYRKDILVKNGEDITKTEHKIMLEKGFYRIYDSGSMKFIWN